MLYLSDDRGHRVEVVIASLGDGGAYREGVFFSTLTVKTVDGARSFKWLPKKTRDSTRQWLKTFWYRNIAHEVSKAASEVRLIFGLGYLRDSRFQRIREICIQQRDRFQEIPPDGVIEEHLQQDFQLLFDIAGWKESDVDLHRQNYVNARKIEFAEYFDTIEKNPLTERQREACIIDQDNNLVLAGAGTGKTSTMIGRAGFLVKSGQSTPNQILMLAFANKAASEMQERLDSRLDAPGITASTFHKLGKNIIATVEGAQPSVSALAEDDTLLASHVNQWFEEMMKDASYEKKVLKYFEYYLYPAANPFDFKSEGEYFDYILANDIRTLKGEMVKSLGECLVANHLFKLGIDYQYEAAYEHTTRSLDFRQYQPDFYLPEHGIYIEYVGINRNGDTAPYVDKAAYHRSMEWKRDLHKAHGTTMIEAYHYEHLEGVLFQSLESKLALLGIEFEPLPPESTLETLREFGAISALAELLSQLLRRYKAGHFDEARIAKVVRNSSEPKRVAAILELLDPIVKSYEAELQNAAQIDFEDMIGRAISYVQNGRFRSSWRYILVDEFQDVSDPRARLVMALRDSVRDCSLFCVGDDWQAIYRFTGSDISFTTHFEEVFGPTKVTALDKTFRFNNSICQVASEFVLKNPAQVRKTLTTHSIVNRPAVSLLRKSPDPPRARTEVDSRLYDVLTKLSTHAKEGDTVFLLGRFGFNLPSASVLRRLNKDFPGLAIQALTMHGSKGKEADFVVLLGLQSGKHGFPSRKATHPMLDALLPKLESFAFAEERRLFYVALTRARSRAYLITDMAAASDFVVELVTDKYPIELDEFETSLAQQLFQVLSCNKCVTGTMVPRRSNHGAFYGCSHYPLCDNSENGCRSCGNPMQRIGRFKVCINPDCGTWVPTCPSCGGEMTQRSGPYGSFWGCRNYRNAEPVSCSHTEQNIIYEPERM